MTYPFVLHPVAPQPWHRLFVAAVSERAWSAAAGLLAQNGPGLSIADATAETAAAILVFVTEAPESNLRSANAPGLRIGLQRWRPSIVGRMVNASLQTSLTHANQGPLSSAHYHLSRAIALKPRTKEQEMAVISAMTEVASTIGEMEEALVKSHPELENEPLIASPHPEELRRNLPTGYHPSLVSDLLLRATLSGASEAFLELGIRLIAAKLHWPSWRQLDAGPSTLRPALTRAAEQVLRCDMGLSDGALAHLDAFVQGLRFPVLPAPQIPEDPEF